MTALATPLRRARQSARGIPPTVWAAAIMLGILVLAALVPAVFTSGDPLAADPLSTLRPPSPEHLFGTDENGRDVLTRVIYGAAPSLLTGLGASLLAIAGGVVLGVIAAQGGKWADAIVSRVLEIMLAIPGLLLVLLVIAVLGKGTANIVIGIALFSIPGYARLVRAEILILRRSGFVESAIAIGVPRLEIIARHIVPNAVRPVIILGTIGVGSAIGVGASLSFLGLGPQPPAPEWGAMLAASQDYFSVAWWAAFFPGLAITVAVLSITVVGQYLQRRMDGRFR